VEALSPIGPIAEVLFFRCSCWFWFRVQRLTSLHYFEEAVEDDEECLEIGRKKSAKDIFLTLATDFLTEAPALEHLFLN
jgi:hypothetical protein